VVACTGATGRCSSDNLFDRNDHPTQPAEMIAATTTLATNRLTLSTVASRRRDRPHSRESRSRPRRAATDSSNWASYSRLTLQILNRHLPGRIGAHGVDRPVHRPRGRAGAEHGPTAAAAEAPWGDPGTVWSRTASSYGGATAKSEEVSVCPDRREDSADVGGQVRNVGHWPARCVIFLR
jgi:hypothetical protein